MRAYCAAYRERERVKKAGRPKPAGCEVCGAAKKLFFDHDHGTDEFRGWICNNCNLALGHAGDSPKRLRQLATYLESYMARSSTKLTLTPGSGGTPEGVYPTGQANALGPRVEKAFGREKSGVSRKESSAKPSTIDPKFDKVKANKPVPGIVARARKGK
jgi:hypothetical protein